MRWAATGLVVVAACGCSSSAYDALLAKRVADYRTAAEFGALRPAPTPVADGRAELRLPNVLVNQLAGDDARDRGIPPFIADFPGFAGAFEAGIDAGDGRFFATLAVGLVPTADRRKEEVAAAILRQVRKDEEFGQAAWAKGRELADEAAAIRTWDVLSLQGAQPFSVTKAGVTDRKRLPGTTEVWLSAEPGQKATLILAWRVPEEAAGSLPMPAIPELAARTTRLVAP